MSTQPSKMPPEKSLDGEGHEEKAAASPRAERKRQAAQERKSIKSIAYTEGIAEESLEDRAGLVSDWLLSYLTPLLRQGASKVLEQEDVGVPSKRDRADLAFELVQVTWKAEREKSAKRIEAARAKYDAKLLRMSEARRQKAKPFRADQYEPSVYQALVTGFGGWKVVWAIFLYVISALLNFIPVLILEDLVKFFEAGGTTQNYQGYMHPWGEVAVLAALPLFVSVLQTRQQVIMAHCAIFVRTAVSTLLYEKSLTVSAGGRARTSTGQVVNMMSNDTTQLQRFLQFVGMTIVAPLQIVISLVLIYGQVGNATWVGVGFMVFLAPINIVVFSIVGKMRRKVLKYSDLRVKMMNEILNGIRIIKFYAWEKPFAKEVAKLRDAELRALTKLAYVSAIGFSMVLLSAPIIQPILVFLTYINVQDEPLTASTAFTTVALFNIMRFPFAFMPMGLLQYIQSKISLRRLGTYLQLPELQPYAVDTPHPDHAGDPSSPGYQVGSVTMKDSSFSWVDPKAPPPPPEKVSKKERRKSRRNSSSKGGDTSMASSVHSLQSQYSAATNGGDEEQNGNPPDNITLRDISCTIENGSLVAVVGTVGSGKSSFLSAILGEMEALNDSKVYIPRPEPLSSNTSNNDERSKRNFMSYCCQSPWVVNDTLRDNILFGRSFDQDRYDQVLQSCALNDDLGVLPAGDLTEIGERGINLSGGQKARVSLARAMYATETRILLLDDPLSAVDAHVGEHLFRHALTGDVSKGKTRILVTHHVHFLPRCDKVIVLKRGRIAHMGTYQECIDAGVDFAGAVDVSKGTNPKPESAPPSDVEVSKDTFEDEIAVPEATTETATDEKKTETEKQDMVDKGKTLMSTEEREEGTVAGSAYVHYMRVGGVYVALMAIIIQGLGRGSEIMASFWLSFWAKATTDGVANDDPLTTADTTFYLNIYALFGMLGVTALTIRALLLAVHRLRASRKIHVALTDSIMRAPVAFFDVTPTGRVLNRFAADMDKVDLELTQSLGQGFGTIFSVLGAIGAIVAATKGTFLVPLLPIGYVYYLIQKWFRRTSTELQRLTSIANSPIFADFSQTLSGTSTIRAYGEQGRFFAHCRSSFDQANASYLLVQLANYWLGLRLDCLGGLIGAFVAGMAVATASSNFIPAGWLGLALSYSIEVTNFLKHGVRMMATVEAQMNSVERILYYSENIEREAPDVIPEKDPDPTTWPSAGCLEFKNVSMRYRDGPLVLKDISFNLKGGEKIGVCGRTGSGKSSLMIALFRICEPEPDGGSIIIDGVNTSEIGTSALRLNLSIIPQDPVMFSNSVRYNLDPFGASTDLELWTVLGKVQLAEVIAALPKGLDQEVAEGGENFSQGQRQLLCIARSLLRDPKVLIMDEATASIDNETDALIQTMIRDNFANATILTIAHRLNTIMDSDRVLVLDDGRIAEFDTPSVLLSKKDSLFKQMVDQSHAAHGKSAM